MCKGARYLGGYIGYKASKHNFLKSVRRCGSRIFEQPAKPWENIPVKVISMVVLAIKSEWIFLQLVTKNAGDAFAGVENMIRENFLPRLLFGK